MGYINTDVPELRGYDTGTVLANLERMGHRLDAELESTVAQLYELAAAIRKDAAEDPETAETILRALAAEAPHTRAHPDTLPVNREAVERLTHHMGLAQRLVLYRAITEAGRLIHATPPAPPPRRGRDKRTAPPISHTAKGRIAYMPNAFADKAYHCFSRHLAETRGTPCRAAVFHSFSDVCEEVTGGLCEYCILPLENTLDGKLTGFARLIIKHHLFITSVCDVENHALAEGNITRFALLERAPEPPPQHLPPLRRPRYLELLHTTATSPSPAELMAAATFCGMTLCRADTLPHPEDPEAPPPICMVWDMAEAAEDDISVFLGYLVLEAAEDTLMGLYGIVE